MQDHQEPVEVTTDLMTIAEAQAAKDAALMSALIDRRKRAKTAELVLDEVHAAEDAHDSGQPVPMARIPLNRAQRRAQVKVYAKLLAATERQTPIVNPTIIPKAARRQRKHSRYAH